MTDQLVDHVGLRRVERHRRVADVLRRRKAAIGQGAEELGRRHEARHRAEPPPAEFGQSIGDVGKLRHSVGRQIEHGGGVAVLGDRVLGVQCGERRMHRRPDLVLDGRVVDHRRACAQLEARRQLGDVVATLDVLGIGDTGMVGGELEDGTNSYGHCPPCYIELSSTKVNSTEMARYPVAMQHIVESNCPGSAPDRRQIDSVDRAMIAALVHDARISLTDLAETVNVSRSTAHTRLQRLRDDNVITGFTATVDPQAVGLGVAALVFIDIEQHDWRTLRAELAAIPGVEYLAMCAGRFDLMLIARAENIPALARRVAGADPTHRGSSLDRDRRDPRRGPRSSPPV